MSDKVILPKNKHAFITEVRKNWPLFIMMLPAIIILLINNYLPMAGIIIAFKDLNYRKGLFGSDWVGFDNFKYLFISKNAWLITRNTLGYNFVFISLGIILGIIVAIILNEIINRKIVKIYQTLIFLPYFLSWVVISYLVFSMLSTEKGIANTLILSLGGEKIRWYMTPKFWPFIMVFVNAWKYTGYDSVIFLAAIAGISKSFYEAATIDGANKWQQMRFITLPSLKPMIIVLSIMRIGRIFYADFGLFYNIPRGNGVLFDVTNVIDTYVYRALFETHDLGMSAAAGLYQAVIGFILVYFTNLTIKKINPEHALF